MSDKDIEKTPLIRFRVYADAWKEYKLGEVSTRITRKNTNLESTLPLTISAQYGVIDQNDFFNKQVASRDVRNYFLMKKGEFAYNKSYSRDYPLGAVKRLDKYDKGILSTLYIVFRPKAVTSDYLVSYYDSFKWHKEVAMRAAEGARNHGLLNIAPKDFFETQIYVPINKNEQEKIGRFFKEINKFISLQQRELELLQLEKQTLLSKMFPKEGELVPEIRFKRLNDGWQRVRLGSLYNIVSGYAFKMSDYSKKGVPIINGESIQHGVIESKRCHYLPSIFKETYSQFLLYTNDIVLGLNRPITNGYLKIAQIPEGLNESLLYQRAGKIEYLKEDDKIFSYYLLEKEIYNYVLKEAVGSDQPFISITKLKQWEIHTPKSEKEKVFIGLLFKSMDNNIILHQKKVEAIKKIKKTLLKYMFI